MRLKKLIKFPTSENSKILIDENYGVRSTYMLSELYGEYLTLFSKLPATIFRPHNFYGPRMGMSHVIPELAQKITKKKWDSNFKKNKIENNKNVIPRDKQTFKFIWPVKG